MRRVLMCFGLVAGLATPTLAQPASNAGAAPGSTAAPSGGLGVFQEYCASCHGRGPGHPGTGALSAMFGADKAALLDNGSLNAALVKNVVRHGLGQMPPFRPGELSDSQLDQLANYLASGPHPNDGSPAWGYP